MIDEIVRQKLKTHLIRDEGWRRKIYKDSEGVLSIGCGRNIADRGLSDLEIEMLLNNDIDQAEKDAQAIFGDAFLFWAEARQVAIMNMLFNLGMTRFKGFVRMIGAINEGDWEKASEFALDSLWAKQVKGRATRIARLLKDGECNTD
jgi:lysozyme